MLSKPVASYYDRANDLALHIRLESDCNLNTMGVWRDLANFVGGR